MSPNGYMADKAYLKQSKKVFVGGIPQNIDETSFCEMFSQIGKIEKAWLQWQHAPDGQPTYKHRGFGFIVFREKRSIDDLLGQEMSKHVWFGDSLKLEVKRATAKADSPFGTPPATPEYYSGRTFGYHHRQSLQKAYGEDFTNHSGGYVADQAASRSRAASCSSSTTWPSNPSPSSPESWSKHPWLFQNGPSIPPFPVESKVTEPSHNRVVASMNSPQQPFTSPPSPPIQSCTDYVATFLGGLGQRPRDSHELEQMLHQAQPECYED